MFVLQGRSNTSEPVQLQYSDVCTEYNGICAEHLKQLGNNTSLFTLELTGIANDDFNNFIEYLNQYSGLINKQCSDVVIPFLCQYAFPPCDVSSGDVNVISKAQCINIRDAVCSLEWNLVSTRSSSAATLLPNCESFNNDNHDDENILLNKTQPLQCHYQFKEFCGLCLPLCGKFSQYRVETKFEQRSILILSGIAAFIGGILVFIVSVYRRKAM